jgi:predicted RNase H-like HicB family nuclease
MHMTAVLTPVDQGGFMALNPETGTATQGNTFEEALSNLREAVELYLEDMPLSAVGATIITSFDIELGEARHFVEDDAARMQVLVQEGLASVVLDADPREVLRQIMAERPALRG